MIDQLKKNECTGCKMCGDVCPVHAITYETDSEGFWYPSINEKLCIHCEKCSKYCPEQKKTDKPVFEKIAYAAWNKEDSIRLQSTSGGIFHAFAKNILAAQGAVAGCVYGKNYKTAFHILSESEQDLKQIIGSKYFQSDTAGIYTKILEYVKTGKPLLFCGSPCQCAALRNFTNNEYPNLYIAEYICLGINSPKAFSAFLTELESKYKSPAKKVQLKNKKTGWTSLATYVLFENGKEYHADKTKDMWVKGFIEEHLYIRPSCTQCTHRGMEREGDITIADYWGIKNMSQDNMFKGISALIINSEKGKELFEMAKQDLEYSEHKITDILKGNPAYTKSVKLSDNRKTFFETLPKSGFTKSVQKAAGIKTSPITLPELECMKQLKEFANLKNIVNLKKFSNWKNNPGFQTFSNITAGMKDFKFEFPEKYDRKYFFEMVDLPKYIYYNYFCKNVIRKEGAYIIPFKNAEIDLDKTAQIKLNKGFLEIGINKLRKSKSPTQLRMGKNAKWIVNDSVGLFYNTVLEIQKNARFESGFFTANGGCVIICNKHIKFGKNVMLGRNIIIYDSDHHQLLDTNGRMKNPPEEVIIEDNVWLTSNIVVLKGVKIGSGSVVAAYTVISKDLPANAMAAGKANAHILHEHAKWSRHHTS